MPDLTLREWEQGVILCSLDESLWRLLDPALERPTSLACRRHLAKLRHWRPFVDGALTSTAMLKEKRKFLRNELAWVWRLLDTPTLACTGLARDMLLVEHGRYLRELLQALAKTPGAWPVEQEVTQALTDLDGSGRRGLQERVRRSRLVQWLM